MDKDLILLEQLLPRPLQGFRCERFAKLDSPRRPGQDDVCGCLTWFRKPHMIGIASISIH